MTLTTADLLGRAHDGLVAEIDPAARPRRRTFTAAEKLAHLDAYDALPKGSEERGAYLRREGLYSSHLSEWRKQRDRGALSGLTPKSRPAKRSAERANAVPDRNATGGGLACFSRGSPSPTPTTPSVAQPDALRVVVVKEANVIR